jgi:hypothetical protein
MPALLDLTFLGGAAGPLPLVSDDRTESVTASITTPFPVTRDTIALLKTCVTLVIWRVESVQSRRGLTGFSPRLAPA